MFNKNDRVKVVNCCDKAVPINPEFMGQIGTVVQTGNGTKIAEMIVVEFNNKKHDSFWPEELEKIDE